MADMKAMNALFQMCSELQKEVKDLKAVVKALVESNNKKSVAIKEVVDNSNSLSEEVNKALDDNEEKVVQLSAEIEEIRDYVIICAKSNRKIQYKEHFVSKSHCSLP